MRIVTWNMNVIGKDRAAQHSEAWAFLLQELNPDIALLQEVAVPETVESDYSVEFTARSPKKLWGSAILSRVGDLTPVWDDYSRGAALAVTASVDGIEPVSIACLQAVVPEGGVIRPLRQTLDALRPLLDERFIVGGDFNTARQAHRQWPHMGHGQFWSDIEEWGFKEPLPLDESSSPSGVGGC